ncbi:MAG TPA: hypothetical protein DCS28_01630 [Candidatus Moranbacteria bacterium]|nr:hypothetical protein [Candidatus Moranbacteria bacterium]HAT74725.1 hypothetical protein [Candidatus Moranbacteria bacterium]
MSLWNQYEGRAARVGKLARDFHNLCVKLENTPAEHTNARRVRAERLSELSEKLGYRVPDIVRECLADDDFCPRARAFSG